MIPVTGIVFTVVAGVTLALLIWNQVQTQRQRQSGYRAQRAWAPRSTQRPARPARPCIGSGSAPGPSRRNWDSGDNPCSICLDELDGTHTQVTNSCGHTFHSDCLLDWYENKDTCPICRASILPKMIFH